MERISTWPEWCKVHADLEFWRDEIRAICASHGVEVVRVEGTFPGTHAVFFVNDELVLKIFCPIRYNSYDLELRLHEEVLADSHLYPRVRFHGRSPSGYGYLAFERLQGTPVREVDRATIPRATVEELARVIADLQAATMEPADASSSLRCLLHYDLTEDHIYLDGNGRLEGILDWGDAKTGHPAEEFPVLFVCCFGCDDDLIEGFRRAYDAISEHYQIRDEDLVAGLQVHPFRKDIVTDLARRSTPFARRLLARVS